MKTAHSKSQLERLIALAVIVSATRLPSAETGPCNLRSLVDDTERVWAKENADGTVRLRMPTQSGGRDETIESIGDSDWQTCRAFEGSLLLFGRNE
jgi:hypothetical protein